MSHPTPRVLLLALLALTIGFVACTKDKADVPAPAKPSVPATRPAATQKNPAPPAPPVAPLRAWALPVPPVFTPTARLRFVHNAHTAWNQTSCSGPVLEQLRAFLEAEPNTDRPTPTGAVPGTAVPFWVGPDSLAPRELAADLRGAPVSPLPWVRFLRERGVKWMVLGRTDRQLGRESIEQLARDTGMRFVTDVWEGPAFSGCVTESVTSLKIAVCALSSDSPDAAATWSRLRATVSVADLRVLFTSGDPAWQKALATLPDPPDVFILGGIVHYPNGRMLTPERIAVASGADLRHIGELVFSPGKTPGARPFLVSDHLNLAEERARLQEGFDNVSRILGQADLASRQRAIYERRVTMIRADWERTAARADAYRAQAAAHDGPRVSFSLLSPSSCAKPPGGAAAEPEGPPLSP